VEGGPVVSLLVGDPEQMWLPGPKRQWVGNKNQGSNYATHFDGKHGRFVDDPWHSSHGIMDIMDIMAARYGASDFIGRHDDQALVPFFGSWSAPELNYSCCVSMNMFKEFTLAQELHISSEKELGTRDTSPLALTWIWFRHDLTAYNILQRCATFRTHSVVPASLQHCRVRPTFPLPR